jgi:hypothetical protein
MLRMDATSLMAMSGIEDGSLSESLLFTVVLPKNDGNLNLPVYPRILLFNHHILIGKEHIVIYILNELTIFYSFETVFQFNTS